MEEVLDTQNTQESQPIIKKTRIEWIDVAKFFALFLMFAAHGLDYYPNTGTEILRALIYSFHMPIFFILSMMTCSLSKDIKDYLKKTKKRAIHLLIPYFIVFVCYTIIDLTYLKVDPTNKVWWTNHFYRFIGIEYHGNLVMGPVWFLMSLFVGQSIFDFLHLYLKKKSYLLLVTSILTAIGVLMGISGIHFPFTLDMVLSSMIFLFVGYLLRDYDFKKNQVLRFIILFIVWLVTLLLTYPNFNERTYYEVWYRRYPLFPICTISAIAGSLVFMYLIQWFCKIRYIYKPFAYIGRWTLILVCVHAVDQNYFDKWFMFFPDNLCLNDYIGGLIGLFMSLIIVLLILIYKKIVSTKLTRNEIYK